MSHYLHSKEKMSRSVLMFWHGMGFSCLKMYSTQYTTNTPRIYCYVPSRGSFTFPVYMASCGLRKNVHVFEMVHNRQMFGISYHYMCLQWEIVKIFFWYYEKFNYHSILVNLDKFIYDFRNGRTVIIHVKSLYFLQHICSV